MHCARSKRSVSLNFTPWKVGICAFIPSSNSSTRTVQNSNLIWGNTGLFWDSSLPCPQEKDFIFYKLFTSSLSPVNYTALKQRVRQSKTLLLHQKKFRNEPATTHLRLNVNPCFQKHHLTCFREQITKDLYSVLTLHTRQRRNVIVIKWHLRGFRCNLLHESNQLI